MSFKDRSRPAIIAIAALVADLGLTIYSQQRKRADHAASVQRRGFPAGGVRARLES